MKLGVLRYPPVHYTKNTINYNDSLPFVRSDVPVHYTKNTINYNMDIGGSNTIILFTTQKIPLITTHGRRGSFD